jgi:hypothetical protein
LRVCVHLRGFCESFPPPPPRKVVSVSHFQTLLSFAAPVFEPTTVTSIQRDSLAGSCVQFGCSRAECCELCGQCGQCLAGFKSFIESCFRKRFLQGARFYSVCEGFSAFSGDLVHRILGQKISKPQPLSIPSIQIQRCFKTSQPPIIIVLRWTTFC